MNSIEKLGLTLSIIFIVKGEGHSVIWLFVGQFMFYGGPWIKKDWDGLFKKPTGERSE